MTSDLISRSALKDKLKINFSRKPEAQAIYQHLIDIVDDCPAVNDCPSCEYKINYDYLSSSSSYKELQALRKFKKDNERPQGEWIIDGHHIRCNRCNEYICNTDREGNKIPDNFCPNCGARMEGSVE